MELNGLFCADMPLRNYSLTLCLAWLVLGWAARSSWYVTSHPGLLSLLPSIRSWWSIGLYRLL